MLAARFARQATVAGRRTYAVAAAGSKSGVVTPPVALYGVDGTYANALVGIPHQNTPNQSF